VVSGAAAAESVPVTVANSACVAGVTLGQGRSSAPAGAGPIAHADLDEYLELHAYARTGVRHAASAFGSTAAARSGRNRPGAP
jgi:hypothetical protein